MVQNAFSVPGAKKPKHIFYDTNCLALQQAEKSFPWFKGISMCRRLAFPQQAPNDTPILPGKLQSCPVSRAPRQVWEVVLQYICCRAD